MLTINNNYKFEYEIKKSKFISLLYPINSLECVNELLEYVKKEYKCATHYCYAYIYDNYEKCSDDGEPSGTAGIPILSILRKENVTNILCIVVRYFGGIKLGSGGLIRSYSKACKEVINNSNLIVYKTKYKLTITFNYENNKQIDYLLKNSEIIDKQFNDKITYTIITDEYELIKDELSNLCLNINQY